MMFKQILLIRKMIITEDLPGYEQEYIYGGSNLFTPISQFFSRVFSSGTSKVVKNLAKSTAKKIATDASKKLLDVGTKKAEQLAREKIKNLIINKKQEKPSLKVSNAPPVATIPFDTPQLGKIPKSKKGLNEGLGIKVI